MIIKFFMLIFFFRSLHANDYLSCDFKRTRDLCGWKNDEKASDDFITLLDIEEGDIFNYYQHWDPSLLQKGTARLISPYYTRDLEKNGCFTFYYKILSQDGSNGIRVYQKPDYISLEDFVAYNDDAKKNYTLYEDSLEWAQWNYKVLPLKQFDSDFKIIIEGRVYNRDDVRSVGIDDVALRQGTSCSNLEKDPQHN